jgi:YggT family protein
MLVLQMLNTWLLAALAGAGVAPPGLLVVAVAELLSKTVWTFTGAIFIQVVASWVAPGTYNPVMSLIDTLTEPVMRPARRIVPPLGGLDLSPMVALVALQLVLMLLVAPLRDIGYALL